MENAFVTQVGKEQIVPINFATVMDTVNALMEFANAMKATMEMIAAFSTNVQMIVADMEPATADNANV